MRLTTILRILLFNIQQLLQNQFVSNVINRKHIIKSYLFNDRHDNNKLITKVTTPLNYRKSKSRSIIFAVCITALDGGLNSA